MLYSGTETGIQIDYTIKHQNRSKAKALRQSVFIYRTDEVQNWKKLMTAVVLSHPNSKVLKMCSATPLNALTTQTFSITNSILQTFSPTRSGYWAFKKRSDFKWLCHWQIWPFYYNSISVVWAHSVSSKQPFVGWTPLYATFVVLVIKS